MLYQLVALYLSTEIVASPCISARIVQDTVLVLVVARLEYRTTKTSSRVAAGAGADSRISFVNTQYLLSRLCIASSYTVLPSILSYRVFVVETLDCIVDRGHLTVS